MEKGKRKRERRQNYQNQVRERCSLDVLLAEATRSLLGVLSLSNRELTRVTALVSLPSSKGTRGLSFGSLQPRKGRLLKSASGGDSLLGWRSSLNTQKQQLIDAGKSNFELNFELHQPHIILDQLRKFQVDIKQVRNPNFLAILTRISPKNHSFFFV